MLAEPDERIADGSLFSARQPKQKPEVTAHERAGEENGNELSGHWDQEAGPDGDTPAHGRDQAHEQRGADDEAGVGGEDFPGAIEAVAQFHPILAREQLLLVDGGAAGRSHGRAFAQSLNKDWFARRADEGAAVLNRVFLWKKAAALRALHLAGRRGGSRSRARRLRQWSYCFRRGGGSARTDHAQGLPGCLTFAPDERFLGDGSGGDERVELRVIKRALLLLTDGVIPFHEGDSL